ncbi:RNA-binding transcriptional accessory protein [Vicingaceae bacterium]|nr:RNA-binding transcriptional accessory protein [Vicingaceae bacterium]
MKSIFVSLMTNQIILSDWLTKTLNIPQKSVIATLELLDSGATIPFISRYRKEATGNLDEVEIESIFRESERFKELEKRKESILKSIDAQGKLTSALKEQIQGTFELTTLEDIYLPYKLKRETKANKAIKKGLEPLAKIIMSQEVKGLKSTASKFVTKEVADVEEVLEGARHIIAEWINERLAVRDILRRSIEQKAVLESKQVKGKDEEAEKFKDYFDWSEPLKKVPAHRFLAMARGEKLGYLRIKISLDKAESEEKITNYIIRKNNFETAEQIELAIVDSWKRLLHPSLENEFKKKHKEEADLASIQVFSENLRQLLLAPPLGQKRTMAIDPGFRTGCKVVCLDETGKLLYNETIYPNPPKNEGKMAAKKIGTMVSAYKIDAIAIGNGTAGRETEQFIQNLIFDRKVFSYMVNENGASIYSASKIAREEFPDYDVTVRGSVSIGRRLMDPLAELVKIDAKSIGVGQYQHDVDQKMLQESLDRVVASAVNKVGVNLNTASKHLLAYVSGLGPKLAENIVSYREKEGAFEDRKQLKEVKGMGAVAFQQSAGFLRIRNGKNPLDETGIHPERYKVLKKILSDNKINLTDLKYEKEKIESLQMKQYISPEIGELTLNDIKNDLLKPGRDPREKMKVFQFDSTVKTIGDLCIGMELPALVTNITNFGAFVDIGVKQDGLVHISNLANKFVSDPNEVVSLGQAIRVKVLEVDAQRKRIQLSLKDVSQ